MPKTASISTYSRAQQTEKRLREAILDVLCYFAPYGKSLSDKEITTYLPVKANMVGVRTHLHRLKKRGKLAVLPNGRYGLKNIQYHSEATFAHHISKISTRVKSDYKFVAKLPFVHTVAVTAESALLLGAQDYQLMFLCAPGRLYIVKSLVEYISNKKNTKSKPLTSPQYPLYYTNKALRFRENMGHNELSRTLWFALAQPVFGEQAWQARLQKTPSIASKLPNYEWGYYNEKLGQGVSKLLDTYDNTLYKNSLRYMAKQADYQAETSLLRVRPDCFLALIAHRDSLEAQSVEYGQLRAKL